MSQLRATAAQQLLEALRESQALSASLSTQWQQVEACKQLGELLESVTELLVQLFGRYSNSLFLEGLNAHLQSSAQLLNFGLLKVARLIDNYYNNYTNQAGAQPVDHVHRLANPDHLASLHSAAASAAADIQLALTVLATAVQYLEATQTLQQAEAAAVHHMASTNIAQLLQDSAAGSVHAGDIDLAESPEGFGSAKQIIVEECPAGSVAAEVVVLQGFPAVFESATCCPAGQNPSGQHPAGPNSAGPKPAGQHPAGQNPAGQSFVAGLTVSATSPPAAARTYSTYTQRQQHECATREATLSCLQHTTQVLIPDPAEPGSVVRNSAKQAPSNAEVCGCSIIAADDVKLGGNHTLRSAVVGDQKQLLHTGATAAMPLQHQVDSGATNSYDAHSTPFNSSPWLTPSASSGFGSTPNPNTGAGSIPTGKQEMQHVEKPRQVVDSTARPKQQEEREGEDTAAQQTGSAHAVLKACQSTPFAAVGDSPTPSCEVLQNANLEYMVSVGPGVDDSAKQRQAGKQRTQQQQHQHQQQQSMYECVRLQALRELLVPGSTWTAAEDGANFQIISPAAAKVSSTPAVTQQQAVQQQEQQQQQHITLHKESPAVPINASASDSCKTAEAGTAGDAAENANSPATFTVGGMTAGDHCKQQQQQQQQDEDSKVSGPTAVMQGDSGQQVKLLQLEVAASVLGTATAAPVATSWLQHHLQQVYNNPLLQGPKQQQQRHAMLHRSLEISSGTTPPTNLQGFAVDAATPVERRVSSNGSPQQQQQQQRGRRGSTSGSGYVGLSNQTMRTSSFGSRLQGYSRPRSASRLNAPEGMKGVRRRGSEPGDVRVLSTEQMVRELLGRDIAAAAASGSSSSSVAGRTISGRSSLYGSMRDSVSSTGSYAAAAAAKRRTVSISGSSDGNRWARISTSGAVLSDSGVLQGQSRGSSRSSSRGRSRGSLVTSLAGASVVQLLAGAAAAAAAAAATTGSSGTAAQQQLQSAASSSEGEENGTIVSHNGEEATERDRHGSSGSSNGGSAAAAVDCRNGSSMKRSSSSSNIASQDVTIACKAPEFVATVQPDDGQHVDGSSNGGSSSSGGGGACVNHDDRVGSSSNTGSSISNGSINNCGCYFNRYKCVKSSSRTCSAGDCSSSSTKPLLAAPAAAVSCGDSSTDSAVSLAAAAADGNSIEARKHRATDNWSVPHAHSQDSGAERHDTGLDSIVTPASINNTAATGGVAASMQQSNSSSSILHIARCSSSSGGDRSSSSMRLRRLSSSAAAEAAVRKCSFDIDALMQQQKQQQQRWQQQQHQEAVGSCCSLDSGLTSYPKESASIKEAGAEQGTTVSPVCTAAAVDSCSKQIIDLEQQQQQWEQQQQQAWRQCHHDLRSFDGIDGLYNPPQHLLPASTANSSEQQQQQQHGQDELINIPTGSHSIQESTAAAAAVCTSAETSGCTRTAASGEDLLISVTHNEDHLHHDGVRAQNISPSSGQEPPAAAEMLQSAAQSMNVITDRPNDSSSLKMLSNNTTPAAAAAAAETLQTAPQSLLAAGNASYTNGSYTAAAKLYRAALDKLGEQGQDNRNDSGYNGYDGCIDDDMLVTKCKLNLACCHLRMGQYRQCLAECDKILDVDPFNVVGLCHRGRALLMLQQSRAAGEDLLKAQELLAAEAAAQQQQQGQGLTESTAAAAAAGQAGGKLYTRPMSPSMLAKVKLNNEYWQQRVAELLKQIAPGQ